MTLTKIITDEILYYPRAIALWVRASEAAFANVGHTKAEALSLILRRQYRLHWLRG